MRQWWRESQCMGSHPRWLRCPGAAPGWSRSQVLYPGLQCGFGCPSPWASCSAFLGLLAASWITSATTWAFGGGGGPSRGRVDEAAAWSSSIPYGWWFKSQHLHFRPSTSASIPALLWPGPAVEEYPSPWSPATVWESWRKLQAPASNLLRLKMERSGESLQVALMAWWKWRSENDARVWLELLVKWWVSYCRGR